MHGKILGSVGSLGKPFDIDPRVEFIGGAKKGRIYKLGLKALISTTLLVTMSYLNVILAM